MRIMPLLFCLLVETIAGAGAFADNSTPPLRSVEQIVRDEGKFAFVDGSSYYLFLKDGSFHSGPLGICGRTIDGTWKKTKSTLTIEGRWSWMNGISAENDHRRMVVYVTPGKPVERAIRTEEAKPTKIYDCYFDVEELVKIPKPSDRNNGQN